MCCSYNSVAENIVRDHASPVTHTRRLYALRSVHGCAARRVLGSCSKRAHHPRASPVAAEGEAGPAPEAGCRSSRRRGNLKPYAHNLSPCRTAICASAPMPCQCHVARTCRPLKLTLDLCLQRRPYHVPRLAGPCLAHTALGVAASYAAFLRARLHLLLLCLPCLSVLWRAPVPPAVAHLRHQLAHAMCRGWPKSRPNLPRRRRTLMPHVPLRSTAPPSASPPSHAVCRCA